MRKYTLAVFALFFGLLLQAQQPLALKYKLAPLSNANAYTINGLNPEKMDNEDNAPRNGTGQALRAGRLITVAFTPQNTGKWEIVSGGRLWRHKIVLENAKGITVLGKVQHLPAGASFSIYRPDGSETDYYTSRSFEGQAVISSKIIGGSEAVIEYFEPAGHEGEGSFTIEKLCYVYHYKDPQEITTNGGFGTSGPCEVNVNCAEGDKWKDQKKAVVLIYCYTDGNMQWCSGTLMNNTKQDFKPYILTAMHCGEGFHDSLSNDSLFQYWVFYFNYESPDCNNPQVVGNLDSLRITGAKVRAQSDDNGGDSGSDFLLLELNQKVPLSYNAFYAGWSLDTMNDIDSGVSIHHPSWDIKKISTHTFPLIPIAPYTNSPGLTHWKVIWARTAHGYGVTEGGSSGSPIFNRKGLVVGTLTGGNTTCSNPGETDIYGRMDWHWAKNGIKAYKRLKNWLDSANTGWLQLGGGYQFPTGINQPDSKYLKIYPNPAGNLLTIETSNPISPKNIYITNLLGEVVLTNPILINGQMDITGLMPGIYIITLENDTAIYKSKLVKQ